MEVQQLTELHKHIEAILFVAEQEITAKELVQVLTKHFGEEMTTEIVKNALDELHEQYQSDQYSFHLVNISDGYRLLTKSDYHKTISLYLGIKSKKKLSRAAMETLAIIAYRQPITKATIESIRGVSSDYGIQKLLEKELIEITGRSEGVGRSLLYGTSKLFMDHFGLKSLKDLPKLSEVIPQHNQIGEEEVEEGKVEKTGEEKTEDSKGKPESEASDTQTEEQEKIENNGNAQEEKQPEDQSEESGEQKLEAETEETAVEGRKTEGDEGQDREEGVGEEEQKPEAEMGEGGDELLEEEEPEAEMGEGGDELLEEEEDTKLAPEPKMEEGGDELLEEEEIDEPEIEVDEGLFDAKNEIIADGVESQPEAIEGHEDEPHPPKG